MPDNQPYTIKQVTDNPEWALKMLNTFCIELDEVRRYLDVDRIRKEYSIPEDLPDEYIQDWFGHPDFGRH